MKRLTCSLLLFSLLLPAARQTLAADREAATLLPPTTLLYAELRQPTTVVEVIFDHPLRKRLEALADYQQALESKQFLQFKAAVSIVEAELGMPWRTALQALTSGGVYLAADPSNDGVALLIKARDEEVLQKSWQTFLDLAREDARRKQKDDPIKTGQYREIAVYGVDKAKFALLGEWLVATNQAELGKCIVDRYLDEEQATLAGGEAFQAALTTRPPESTAWAYLNMTQVRAAEQAAKLAEGRTENPLAELLVGGLISNLQQTPYLTASMQLTPQALQLSLVSPHKPAWVPESRQFYFGPDGKGQAPGLHQNGQTLLSLSMYRDLSQMWLRADDLLEQEAVDQLAEANTNLSTLFGGRDFGEEILGAVQPTLQLLVAQQDFSQALPRPAVKLPALALVARLRQPDTMRDELRRTFVSLFGFLNVVGAMNGQPQLDLDIQKSEGQQIVTARYLPTDDERESKAARINFNFSPAVAFRDDLVILATAEPLMRELLRTTAQPAAGDGADQLNTGLQLNFAALRNVLADNRSHLVSQNMLEEGHTKEEAEEQIGALLAILGLLRDAGLTLHADAEQLHLDMELNLAPQGEGRDR